MIWQTHSTGSAETEWLGEVIGGLLKGGEIIELQSDLGGGKTTLTRGIARGLGIERSVTSPTFTISRSYIGKRKIRLKHFDFYRVHEAEMVKKQLEESTNEPGVVTIVEWGKMVGDILPSDRMTISLVPIAGDTESRLIKIEYHEPQFELVRKVENKWEKSKP